MTSAVSGGVSHQPWSYRQLVAAVEGGQLLEAQVQVMRRQPSVVLVHSQPGVTRKGVRSPPAAVDV